MNQVMNIISSLFEPLTKIETYENIATKIAMIVIYIIVALIVIKI
ncbi:mechanosensitive ion channel family protein, partial [Staphylococcus aureus]|nr:mechanosensitive ion channel family protein [Staphylococcus aureus]